MTTRVVGVGLGAGPTVWWDGGQRSFRPGWRRVQVSGVVWVSRGGGNPCLKSETWGTRFGGGSEVGHSPITNRRTRRSRREPG